MKNLIVVAKENSQLISLMIKSWEKTFLNEEEKVKKVPPNYNLKIIIYIFIIELLRVIKSALVHLIKKNEKQKIKI